MKKFLRILVFIAGIYLLLLIPLPKDKQEVQKVSQTPFIWNQDALWDSLETNFLRAKAMPPVALDSTLQDMKVEADSLLNAYEDKALMPNDSFYSMVESEFFRIAPLIAAKKDKSDWYIHFYNRVRKKLKSDSRSWDMANAQSRNTAYRILYGMRAAAEEILLQSDQDQFVSTMLVTDEPSVTPTADILGIEVHSGDLLVSRGGAEVSAFISRGNDYPGNFSHVALVYIDAQTHQPFFVEAHIEKGVAIATLGEYLKDKKLRFMVMRPRADLPEMLQDPMLPHKAARFVFEESQNRHIPYDFKMDYYDSYAMFCSEVGSYAYKHYGIELWEFESTISSKGIIDWLGNFGVENFVTQMPSDLEYDPLLSVVGEWRAKEILFQDHLDNAVMDALIGRANAGEKLDYNIWMLPVARVIKWYSVLLNTFGKAGIIPEGMDAVTALKNTDFVVRFQECKSATQAKAIAFEKENKYLPPYWQLVRMAESSLRD